MFLKRFNNLTVNEKKAFKLYTAHVVLEGIVDGALLLNEFILVVITAYSIHYTKLYESAGTDCAA